MDAVTKEYLDGCRTSYWYNHFRDVTPATKIVKLPREFIDYLLDDGFRLPGSPSSDSSHGSRSNDRGVPSSQSDSDPPAEMKHHSFPDLENEISGAISELGGFVFPKLTWSSPKDAVWLSSTSTLKCSTSKEIISLLKGSDFVMHDITLAYCDCQDLDEGNKAPPLSDHELVLRRWFDLCESMEFRVFIHNRKIVAISQRDTRNYYSFLPPSIKEYKGLIADFYGSNFSAYKYPSIVIDVYVLPERRKVWLLDINPFTRTTDSLLFTWDEILEAALSLSEDRPVESMFMVVRSQGEVAHKTEPRYSTNRYPKEYIYMSCSETMAGLANRLYYEQKYEDEKSNPD